MKVFDDMSQEITTILASGGIGVIRTDTLYGVVARADDEAAVKRVYDLKSRTETKSPIVLISSRQQMFDRPSDSMAKVLDGVWPGKVSVILPADKAPQWLTRGNASVAYRLPASETLRALLEKTGPLIAPSANPEGEPPAMTIAQAKLYFGNDVDFYVDSGEVSDAAPSRLLRIGSDGKTEQLR